MKPVEAGKILNTAVFFQLKTILGLLLAALLATGCNGGGGGGASSAILEGTFIDSAVQGLEYETETQSGMTDENGTFTYMSGETIRFHIGDIVLGEATAQSLMTPVDLVDDATDETHPMVINMARLLQTMDEDMDPDNGIFITDEMIAAMVGHMIDFNMDPDFFEHDPDVQTFMQTLNGMDPLGPMRMMVSADDAQDHLHNTMMNMSGTNMMAGRFVDSAVEGLEYETATQSGMTDENGTFIYMPGETIRFHVGDIVLGQAMAQPMMTPVDLVDGATDETHPMVTNMARLLQTMDEDMDPDNGIFITDEMIAAMVGHMIDFNMDPDFFEHDPDVRMFMDTLNAMAPSGSMRMMVSTGDAQDHLYNTMDDIMSNDFGIMDENNGTMNDVGMMQGSPGMMSSRNSTMR